MLRFLRRLFTVLAVLVGIALVYMVVAGRDIPPPDISDLLVARVEIPPDENAYTYFIAATNVLVWPEGPEFVLAFRKGQSTDVERVRELVAQNAEAIEWIKKGVQCHMFQAPRVVHYLDPMPHAAHWFNIMRLLSLKARLEHAEHRHAEAAGTCELLLKFSQVAGMAPENRLAYTITDTAKRAALGHIRELAGSALATAHDLEVLAAAMTEQQPLNSGAILATQGEFRLAVIAVDEFKRGVNPLLESADSTGRTGARARKRWRLPGFFLQVNRTRLLLAQNARSLIADIPRSFVEMTNMRMEEQEDTGRRNLMFYLLPNLAGRIILECHLPLDMQMRKLKCVTASELAATRLIVALNLHRIEKGAYPATLDALVPDYLEAVPIDPYDGEHFRYLPAKQIVYSVGLNLTDDGGSDEIPEQYRLMVKEHARSMARTLDFVYEFGVQEEKKEEPREP